MGELFDRMTSADALYRAFQKSKRGCSWKGSVQNFERNLLQNIHQLQKELRERTYRQKPFVCFKLSERGKHRLIKSVHIRDRIVQRSLCDEVLTPILEKSLIYDNGASVKGRGISFTRARLQCHLEKFIRRHGLDGWILKVDFSKFFDNIDHELAFRAVAEKIDDPGVLWLIDLLIQTFRVDISHLSDEEAQALETEPYDALKHQEGTERTRFLDRSLGIGSQMSQIICIYYPTPIDHLCKVKLRCKLYGRYMDDIYIIHHDKDFLGSVLAQIEAKAKELKLFVNSKKTMITPLRRGFTFMKIKYRFSETGKITKCLSADAFSRERRRLKNYKRFIDASRLTRRDVANFYQSFRGSAKKFDSYRSIKKLDALYNELF